MAKQIMVGNWVTAHLASGSQPALVTRVNPNNTASLTIFAVGEEIHRDNVAEYVPEADDDEADKIGYWS